MRPDDFENRLSRTPRSPLPGSWKAGILAAAREASATAETANPLRSAEPSVAPWSIRSVAYACLDFVRTPWSVMAAGVALVLALRVVDGWVAARPADGSESFVVSRSGASALAAARSHRDRVVVWVDRGGVEIPPGDEPRPATFPDQGRPRGHWRPGGGSRGNRWNTKVREA